MTDREYVESTVAYLAEHVPWMSRKFMHACPYRSWYGGTPEDWKSQAAWLRTELHTQGNPLVSADWWEERGEPKLAELLRMRDQERRLDNLLLIQKPEHDETGWQPK